MIKAPSWIDIERMEVQHKEALRAGEMASAGRYIDDETGQIENLKGLDSATLEKNLARPDTECLFTKGLIRIVLKGRLHNPDLFDKSNSK